MPYVQKKVAIEIDQHALSPRWFRILSSQKWARAIELSLQNKPDEALTYLESFLQEDQKLASQPYFKYARAYAWATKGGLIQKFISKDGINFKVYLEAHDDGILNEIEGGKEQFEFTNKQLDFLEEALHEVKGIEDFPKFVEANFGFLEDLLDRDEFKRDPWEKKGGLPTPLDSAIAYVLERYRPGRVQEIRGKTRLAYFGPSRARRSVIGKGIKLTLRGDGGFGDLWHIDIEFKSVFRSAAIWEAGKDETGRKYITLALSEGLKPFIDQNRDPRPSGYIRLFTDGTQKELSPQDFSKVLAESSLDWLWDWDWANTMILCDNNKVDEALDHLRSVVQEDPILGKHPWVIYARAFAYGAKGGVVPKLREGNERFVDALLYGDESDFKRQFHFTEKQLDDLEKAIQEIRELNETFPQFFDVIRTEEEEKRGQRPYLFYKTEAIAKALEMFRPGRVQQILGKTRLSYIPMNRIKMLVSGKGVQSLDEEGALSIFQHTDFTCDRIVRSVGVIEAGRDRKSRRYVTLMLFDNVEQFDENGELISPVGFVVLYDDDTALNIKEEDVYKFFCRYCGAENKGDAVFCEKCGKKIA